MTMIFNPELKIAAGFNNAAGLVSIASIVASGDTRPFVAPMAWFNYSPGQFKIRLNQSRYIRGKQNAAWTFTFMTKNQYLHFSDTWCGSGYTGEVTIQTPLRDPTAVSIANAIVYLPAPASTTPRLGKVGNPIKIPIVALEVI